MVSIMGCTFFASCRIMQNIKTKSIDDLIYYADGPSMLNKKVNREGLVFKNVGEPNESFKAISNKFLLKGGD